MILSRSRRFIFLKTIKTGSTSTEIVLSRYCDEADIITYLPPPDEVVRRQFGGRPAQNHRNPWLRRVIGTLAGWDADHRRYRYHHNISANSLRGMISRVEWEGCTKVTIARNPYDRAVSKYYHDAHHRVGIGPSDAEHSTDAINQYLLALPDSDLTNWHKRRRAVAILTSVVLVLANRAAIASDIPGPVSIHLADEWTPAALKQVEGREVRNCAHDQTRPACGR